jgi:methionyl-tRNA synthetase
VYAKIELYLFLYVYFFKCTLEEPKMGPSDSSHYCSKKFYITTPIYYVNAKPHIGSLYSTVLADVGARWNKLRGAQTLFLTGLDEHGQKVADAATKAGRLPKEHVDALAPEFTKVWQEFDCAYDTFIRTTDDYHVKAVQTWLQQLVDRGDVYKSSYVGWYCVGEEAFITEKDLIIDPNKKEPICAFCGRQTRKLEEEGYFFRLSAYQDRLLEFYKTHDDFIVPKERLKEVVSFVESGLRDLSISRSTLSWGIPFPTDTKHVTYVWADALLNYISAIGYGDSAREKEFAYYWPADVQVMGKDIVRFHAVYWLAFLMASDFALPKQLMVHGWLTLGGEKISKSLGNVIDPTDLYAQYGSDVVRYYLVRYMAITQDSPFSIEDMENRATTDLANDLGNLVSRLSALVLKYIPDGVVQTPQAFEESELALQKECHDMLSEASALMDELYYARAYARIWKFVQQVNSYIHAQQPWKIVKTDMVKFSQIMSALVHALHTIAIVCEPIIPQSSAHILATIGKEYAPACNKDYITICREPWNDTFVVRACEPLFKKYDIQK